MSPDRGQRLDTWKAIGAHLGRDVRTVMRWEREGGMPVHRVPGVHRGRSVFAYSGELDAWLASGAPGVPDGPLAPEPAATARRSAIGLLAAAAAVAVLATAAWSLPRVLQTQRDLRDGRETGGAGAPGGLPLAGIEASGTALVARDVEGRIAFAMEHPEGWAFQGSSHGRILDLGGGSSRELLAMIDAVDPTRPAHVRGELYAFGGHGDLLWRHVRDDEIEFGAGVFGAPWLATSVETVALRGGARIAWATQHYRWWPSILVLLDGGGKALSRFVHSGWITEIAALATAGGDRLLLGGISNSRGAAMLAVLDAAAAGGSSPEEPGSPYECVSCPAGRPLLYFVFPPTELTRASGAPYNEVVEIQVTDQRVNVTTREGGKGSDVTWTYELSHDFELLRVLPSDNYWPRLTATRRAGKLPEPVRRWTPAGGWSEIRMPELPTDFSGG